MKRARNAVEPDWLVEVEAGQDFLQGVVLSRPMGDIQSVCKDMDSKQFTNIYFSASTVEDWKQKAQMVK